MHKPGLVTISMNELQRVKVIESVVEGRLTGVRAAEQLGLTERQVSRLKRRFEGAGAAGPASAKRGRPSSRQFKPVAVYSDKASVFYVFYVKNHSATAGQGVTQFGRALYELNIELRRFVRIPVRPRGASSGPTRRCRTGS